MHAPTFLHVHFEAVRSNIITNYSYFFERVSPLRKRYTIIPSKNWQPIRTANNKTTAPGIYKKKGLSNRSIFFHFTVKKHSMNNLNFLSDLMFDF